MLQHYQIPFYFERATLILDANRPRIWYPDFTLPAHGHLIIEYAGMMDRPDYASGIQHKQDVYASNRINALFVYPKDLNGPSWPGQLVQRINDAFEFHSRTDVYALYRRLRP